MKVLDCNKYRVNVKYIEVLLKNLSNDEIVPFIGHLTIITGVPIVIVCFYVMELYGELPGLPELIEDLMNFYHIDEVINYELPS